MRTSVARRLVFGGAVALLGVGVAVAVAATREDSGNVGGSGRTVTGPPLTTAPGAGSNLASRASDIVVGPDGRPVRCADGQLLKIDPGDMPPSRGRTHRSFKNGVETIRPPEYVPRCEPDGEVRWFRPRDDPLLQEAGHHVRP